MGKWDNTVEGLPRLNGRPEWLQTDDTRGLENQEQLTEYQQELERLKTEYTDRAPATMAAEYKRLRGEIDELEDQLKTKNKRLEAVSVLLIDSYRANDVQMLRLDSGGSVSVQREPYPSVKDRDALRAWAIQNGMLQNLNLHHGTVKALTKQRLEAELPPLPGVEVFNKETPVLRKK